MATTDSTRLPDPLTLNAATSEEWRTVVAATLEQMGIACWEFDLSSGETWWSDNAGPLVGRERGFQPGTFAEAEPLFHPDDHRPRSLDAILTLLEEGPVESERRALLPDGSVRWTNHRYFLMRDSSGTPVRMAGVMMDVDSAKRREQRQRLLAEASRLLASSLDYETTLGRIGEVLVPEWADWCAVHLLEHGELRPVVISHRDREKVRLAWELVAEYPPRLDAMAGTGRVVREGVSELLPQVTDDMLALVAQDERHLELVRNLGFTSGMTVPITSGEEVLGSLSLISAEARVRFDSEDLQAAEDLAHRVAAAIDNARLHSAVAQARDRVEQVAERLSRLQQVTSDLSEVYQTREVAELAIKEVLTAARADRGVLLLTDDQGELALVSAPGYPPDRVAGWDAALRRGAGPVARAFHKAVAVYVDSRDQLLRDYPELGETAERALGEAWAALPILSSEGARGVLGLTFDVSHGFPHEDRELIESVVRQAGVALERARLFESQRETVDVLQRGLMPESVPEVPSARLATYYETGGLAKVGGDWYDALLTESGRVAFVIGDVVGRGIPAVSTMAQLRNGLRTLLLEGHPPAGALTLLNRLLGGRLPAGKAFATISCLLYDPAEDLLRWANAGHVPVMLRRGDEEVEALWGPEDVPVGVRAEHSYSEREASVPPGTTLVLYTDGLIERRGEDVMTSIQRLEQTLAQAPRTPQGVVDHLVSRLWSTPSSDDVAVLVARLVGSSAGA